jgi:hypothetical protein
MRSSLAVCGALLATILFGACGGGGDGDDGPTAEAEVRRAAVQALENDDAQSLCRRQLSKAYLARVYDGEVTKCIKAVEASDEDPGKVTATRPVVRADETHAVVAVSVSGGSVDGSSGHLEMVKEGTWKVDDYADDLIRSTFLAAIRGLDEGAISTPGMKACFIRQVNAMPIGEVRELSYTSDANEKMKGNKQLLGMAEKCPASALAEYGATTLTEGVHESDRHKPGYVKCVYKEIKFFLEVTGITTELLEEHPGFAAVAALEGIVEGAKKNCGG